MARTARPTIAVKAEPRRRGTVTMRAMVDQPIHTDATPEPPPAPPDGQPGTSWYAPPAGEGHRSRWRLLAYAIALLPIAALIVLAVVAPNFLSPLVDDRISLVGIPAGILVLVAIALLSLVGVLAVNLVRSPAIVFVVLLLTTWVAMVLILLAPAFVLIAINLS